MTKKQKNKTKVYEDPFEGAPPVDYDVEDDPLGFPKFLLLCIIGVVVLAFISAIIF